MPTGTFNHPLFGKVTFETENKKKWIFGDDITFTTGFDIKDITKVTIPQLNGIKGSKGGVLLFHKKGHAQLKNPSEKSKEPACCRLSRRVGEV